MFVYNPPHHIKHIPWSQYLWKKKACFAVMSYLFATSVYVFGWKVPEIRETNPNWAQVFMIYSLVLVLGILYVYSQSIMVLPGYVPNEFRLSSESETKELQNESEQFVEKKKRSDERRICTKCNHLKPNRAHHCRKCGVCVLKMDHHCSYTDSCIGFHNYKYFFLLCVYTAMYEFVFCILQAPTFWKALTVDSWGFFQIFIIVQYLCSLPMGIGNGSLVCVHVILQMVNLTTLEYLEKYRGRFGPKEVIDGVHPYDLDLMDNLATTVGRNPLLWLLPVRWGVEGDGLNWKTNKREHKKRNERLNLPENDEDLV